MHEGNPVLYIQIGGNGASAARLYIFFECDDSFREIARLIARNSLVPNEFILEKILKCSFFNNCLYLQEMLNIMKH